MTQSDGLRERRTNTQINLTSLKQEKDILQVIRRVAETISKEFAITVSYRPNLFLGKDIVSKLRAVYQEVTFDYEMETSSIKPDGGFLLIHDAKENLHPILIAEVKNQGTNDKRLEEGLKKQAKGNAIERLGKNVIGLRTYMLNEEIFPFGSVSI